MKITNEARRGWGVPCKSILIEKEDLPWGAGWEYNDDKNFKTAVMVALAYHRLVAFKPDSITKNELMGYLGYGKNSTKVKSFGRLNGVLVEIGFTEKEIRQAKPGEPIKNQFDIGIIDQENIKTLKKKKTDEGDSFVQLELFVVHGLIITAMESEGMKFPDYLCVYLQLRCNMHTAYSKNHKFLGFYGMVSLSRLKDRTGISTHTTDCMITAMQQAGLVFKLSGRRADSNGEDIWAANYYATSNDEKLIEIAKAEQQERANYKSQKPPKTAARKGHGSSILDHSITDAVGIVNFQV